MTNTVLEPLNVHEWMLLHGDELADAIRDDGKMDGPKSHPLLSAAQMTERPGRTFHEARKLLKAKLAQRGLGHMMAE